MRRSSVLLLSAGLVLIGAPAVAVQPVATATGWADAPLSPGTWTYRPASNARSRASFGPRGAPVFEIACTNQGGIALFRHGAPAGAMTVRTSATLKTMPGSATSAGLSVAVPAADPILDAMAFSRGRFAVETPGAAALVVPAWPELARVVEDCRRGR